MEEIILIVVVVLVLLGLYSEFFDKKEKSASKSKPKVRSGNHYNAENKMNGSGSFGRKVGAAIVAGVIVSVLIGDVEAGSIIGVVIGLFLG